MESLVQVVCPTGGVVLDTFAGSGSTLIAAARLGRQAIGIEKDHCHIETASRLLTEELSRNILFEPPPAIVQRSLLEAE
jgi:site-specific DNA-methyltransferase (adenine-specific)